jgi:hypothetical protein
MSTAQYPSQAGAVGEFDSPSRLCGIEFFEIEGCAIGIVQPGVGGMSGVWEERGWRSAPALASKDGDRLFGVELSAGFPEASMREIIRLAGEAGRRSSTDMVSAEK